MEGYEICLLGRFKEVRRNCAGDEGVAEAVETVFSRFVLCSDGLVDGVGACWSGDGCVEGGVEEGDVGCFGTFGVDCFYYFEGAGVVEGC